VKTSFSFFHRFLTAIVGLIIGGLVGMLAFYLVMLVVGSDFGLDNVRPGVVLGAAIGSLYSPRLSRNALTRLRMRHLLTVEDTFLIESRGLLVIPAPAVDEVRGPGDIQVELLKPDGSKLSATLTLMSEFLYPPPPVLRWCCMFKSLSRWIFRSARKSGAMKSFSSLVRRRLTSMGNIRLETDLKTRPLRSLVFFRLAER
jgi:hypothetical protein